MSLDKTILLPIQAIKTETPRVKSFVLPVPSSDGHECSCEGDACCGSNEGFVLAKPGQIGMFWLPEYEEMPFGIIHRDEATMTIAAAAVGEGTEAMHALEVGDLIGFRGPYGKPYTTATKGQTIALVAGGYGMVPLAFMAQESVKAGATVHLFFGARNADELLFSSWMKELGVVMHLSTDDGSVGFKGFVPDLFNQEIESVKPDRVHVTGPEIMEYKIALTCWEKKIPFEVSLEKYFKCAIGVCGQCCVDPTGDRMCVEGPVVDGEKLKQITEFGKYTRTPSGAIKPYSWASAK